MSPPPICQADLPIVEIANGDSDRQAGPNRLWGLWRGLQVLLHGPGYQQVESPLAAQAEGVPN
jgi:hypothetical protein